MLVEWTLPLNVIWGISMAYQQRFMGLANAASTDALTQDQQAELASTLRYPSKQS